MSRHEINLKNILHVYKELKSDEAQKLIITIKYLFLKSSEEYYDPEKLKPELLEEKERLYSIYLEDKKHVAGARYGAFQPIALKSQARYYYVPAEDKVYDLQQDIVVPPGYEHYNWFLALKLAQTAPEKINDFLDYQLKEVYHYKLNEFVFFIKDIITTFTKKHVDPELRLFHKLEELINLFEYLDVDDSLLDKKIDHWAIYMSRSKNVTKKVKETLYIDFLKALANEPEAIYVGKIFPDDYKQYIQLYRDQWNYKGKINWPLTDWYLYEILLVFAHNFMSDLPSEKVVDFMLEKFKYKNKNFDRKILQPNIGNRTKLNKHENFLNLLNKIQTKSGL